MAKLIPLPPDIVRTIQEEMVERFAFHFNEPQINRLCHDFGLAARIRRVREFATDEREMFQEGMARRFTGFQWPCNDPQINQWIEQKTGVPACPDLKRFPELLIEGYREYKRRSRLTQPGDPI